MIIACVISGEPVFGQAYHKYFAQKVVFVLQHNFSRLLTVLEYLRVYGHPVQSPEGLLLCQMFPLRCCGYFSRKMCGRLLDVGLLGYLKRARQCLFFFHIGNLSEAKPQGKKKICHLAFVLGSDVSNFLYYM